MSCSAVPSRATVATLAGAALLCLGLASCGETQTCWCRCPSGSSLELSVRSTSTPSCDDICGEQGCWPEESYCEAGTSRSCDCGDGSVGVQTCQSGGDWGECTSCAAPPECLEGRRERCDCSGGREGWRVCESGSWTECTECVGDCVAATTRACTCSEGLAGTQTCGADETWGACTDCAEPAVCEDGEEDICACEGGETGVQHCEGGHWSACVECNEAWVWADIDYGVDGIVVGGSFEDVFDTVEWGCPPWAPGDDSLVWRVFPDDGTHPETIWFELDLPATAGAVEVSFYEMSTTDGSALSQMDVSINSVPADDVLEPREGCVDERIADYSADLFIPGSTNRIEVWAAPTSAGLFHGLQGVWVSYRY